MSLTFFGTGVRWMGERRPDGASARVYVDGELQSTVDTANGQTAAMVDLFVVDGLPHGHHHLEIKFSTPEGASLVVDALDVLGGELDNLDQAHTVAVAR